MSECIFGVYFLDGHECDREFKCEGCETRNWVRSLVEIIMEENREKSNDTCETCKFRTGTRCDKLVKYIDTEDSCGFYKARIQLKN